MAILTKGEQTKKHILKKTRELLTTKGYHNTSVSEIIAACGVQKGNLYHHFPSKEDLGLAVLEDATEEFFAFINQSFAGPTPLDKIFHSLESILQVQRKTHFVGGCLFGNTALEMSDSNPRFEKVIRAVFDRWVALLEKILAQSPEQSGMDAEHRRLLAKLIVAVVEGGIMMAKVNKGGTDLDDCFLSLRRLLTNSCGNTRPTCS